MCVFVFFSIGCTHGPPLPPASVQQYGANDKMDTRATHIYQGTPHLDWAETEDIEIICRISNIGHIYKCKHTLHIAQGAQCTASNPM